MTREEFEKWIENNNFKTIYSLNKKYNYLNTNKFDFNLVCTQDCDGMFGCFKEDSKWELISYELWSGDRPQRYLGLSSNKKFDKEEEALDVLINKLTTRFSSYNGCSICHSRFAIDTRKIPSNQKTFDYKCPNCGAELKIGNTNYSNDLKNEKKEELIDRDNLIKTMTLPKNIRSLSKEERNEIIRETIIKVSRLLKAIKCDSSEYQLSRRQQSTKNNAINKIKAKEFLEAYYEIADFVDDYGDKHNGKVFEIEKQEINTLMAIIYNDIKQ